MITYTKQPHAREHRLIFKNVDREGWDPSIECYLRDGGYDDLKKAFAMQPKEVTEEVKKSGLRGRGGAGFPTGMKWTFIPPNNTKPVYLICNGDESEPGTFKDRYILHQDPHQLVEGMVISAYAVGAKTAYIYIREEFPEAALIVERAIEEARAHNFLGKNVLGSGVDVEIYVHRRGNRSNRVARRQAALSTDQAAVFPCCARTLHVPDHRQQRGIAVPREAYHPHGRR
jgi:NADH-quinone oxidoreductase subunit F